MADAERVEKLNAMKRANIEPYPYSFNQTHHAAEIISNFVKLEGKKVSVAGRLMTIREHGKLTFCDLRDGSGNIQLWLAEDELGKDYDLLKYLEAGDFVGVEGKVAKTKRGEPSVKASKLVVLTKSLRHLPSQWYGLKDAEIRYRQRYVDLIMNPKVKEIFITRTKIVDAIRA
ncbi:MAG TPA: OB-fold nucleic acid binding domain-containing protein, partial [Methylophilaceae bacterium]|nr:OB-fold nucleic acid binding domain-containing protein [Methylophilaceae bacterium]